MTIEGFLGWEVSSIDFGKLVNINASYEMKHWREMSLACLISTKKMLIDDLQMSIKCPTSEEQTCEQEAAAHLDRSSFLSFSTDGRDTM